VAMKSRRLRLLPEMPQIGSSFSEAKKPFDEPGYISLPGSGGVSADRDGTTERKERQSFGEHISSSLPGGSGAFADTDGTTITYRDEQQSVGQDPLDLCLVMLAQLADTTGTHHLHVLR